MTGTPDLIAGIGQAMKHMAERQRVVAQNIANGDTPGYKARDVEAPDFSALLDSQVSGAPRVARPHVVLSPAMTALGASSSSAGNTIADPQVGETKPDGNNVTLEDQLMKSAQIQTDFAALTNLYRKQVNLLKTALGRPSGG